MALRCHPEPPTFSSGVWDHESAHRRGGVAVRLLVAIVVWLAAIAAAVGVSAAVSSSIHPSVDPTSITAAQPDSMFQANNFAEALATIKNHLGANITTEQVVIYPGYVNVQAERGNSAVFAVLYVGGRWREDDGGDATPQFGTFPLSQVRPTEPTAIATQLARYNHVPASELRYMVAQRDPGSKGLRWLTFTFGNSQPFLYTASIANGKRGATGSPAPSTPTSAVPRQAGSGGQQLSRALKLAGCVQAAGADVAKIQACQARYGG